MIFEIFFRIRNDQNDSIKRIPIKMTNATAGSSRASTARPRISDTTPSDQPQQSAIPNNLQSNTVPAYLKNCQHPLPSCWSTTDKFTGLGISERHLRITYEGSGKTDADASTG
jgi:hypothetical protein